MTWLQSLYRIHFKSSSLSIGVFGWKVTVFLSTATTTNTTSYIWSVYISCSSMGGSHYCQPKFIHVLVQLALPFMKIFAVAFRISRHQQNENDLSTTEKCTDCFFLMSKRVNANCKATYKIILQEIVKYATYPYSPLSIWCMCLILTSCINSSG